MDTVGHRLVVALASRLFHIFDVRKMDTPEQTRESSLKFLTRALACMSDGRGNVRERVHDAVSDLLYVAHSRKRKLKTKKRCVMSERCRSFSDHRPHQQKANGIEIKHVTYKFRQAAQLWR